MTDEEKVPKSFDPARHLTMVSGKEYLEVKWRLVWLRSEHPDAHITTEMVEHVNDSAVFQARVSIPEGGSATGWGSEDAKGFGDYLEKAETKAIGRALAALGYGTQFSYDHEFGASAGKVVDAPVQFRSIGSNQVPPDHNGPPPRSGGYDTAATDRQLALIRSLARDQKLGKEDLDRMSQEVTGMTSDQLNRRGASSLIEHMKAGTGPTA